MNARAASDAAWDARHTPGQPNGHDRDATADRFRFTPFREIKLGTAPAYVVRDLIPRLGVVVIWGKPKCGKTFWTFDLEMHVALGWPYRGRRVEQGTVLHIACEGVAGLAARKEAWRLHHAALHPEIDAAEFHLCKETTLDLIRDVDAVAAAIRAQFSDHPIRIITIDTLNRSLKGSESKDEDMAAYIRAAVALAEKFQCAVLIVHHCGYDTTHPRGHTSLIGAVDADIAVTKDDAGCVCTEVQNMRDGGNGAKTCSRLEVVEVGRDDNNDPIVSCVIIPADSETPQKQQTEHRLSPKDQIALDSLRKAIAEAGEAAPASNHVPENVRGATLDVWRRYYLLGSGSDGRTQQARWKAFQRARDSLQAKHVIGVWGDFTWTT